jgi:hypothetical protein
VRLRQAQQLDQIIKKQAAKNGNFSPSKSSSGNLFARLGIKLAFYFKDMRHNAAGNLSAYRPNLAGI